MPAHALSAQQRAQILRVANASNGWTFHDLDFYSSTIDAFTLFEADAGQFLPRIFMHSQDVKGTHAWALSEFAGELLAIEEFNNKPPSKKIAANRSMPFYYPDQWWADQI